MAEKVDSDEVKFNRQRALLVDYLEHASNVITKKVSPTAIPERSNKIKEEDKQTASKNADVLVSPFTGSIPIEEEKVVIEVPVQAPPIVISPSEVDKLLYLREKRGLLEKALLQDDADKEIEKKTEKKEINTQDDVEVARVVESKILTENKVQKIGILEALLTKKPETADSKIIAETVEIKKATEKPVAVENKKELKELVQVKSTKKEVTEQPIKKEAIWQYKLKKYLRRKGVRRLGRGVRRFAYGSLTFAMGFYLAYLLLVYSFAPRSSFFEAMSNQLPAPALISNYGLVDFYSYQQIKNGPENIGSLDDPSLLALKAQIINSLASQYGVDTDLDQDLLIEVLKRKVVADSSMNYYGSRKFIQLKQGQRRGDSLEQMAEKTGLTIHYGAYAKSFAAEKFGDLVYGLPVGSISPVIINNQGIYVLNVLTNSDTKIEFNYLFVPARTLGQLIDEKLADAWIVSLVD